MAHVLPIILVVCTYVFIGLQRTAFPNNPAPDDDRGTIESKTVSLVNMDPEGSFKHCIAAGISRRLAGYWEKFSISNHHVSVRRH